MVNLANILEGIEKLIYDIILSIVLVPKTLIKIIFEPAWIPNYVRQELKHKEEKRFDEYVSPILLMILTSLVPYIYTTVAHRPGVIIRGPAEGAISEPITFSGEAVLTSRTPPYEFQWHAEDAGLKINRIDELSNEESFTWETSGKKFVILNVINDKGEWRNSYPFYIQIRDAGEVVSNVIISSSSEKLDFSEKVFFSTLQASSTIVTIIYLLGMPLLFTLASEVFKGHSLSRTSLKSSFFIQCYYVSPVYLALWTASIGIDFYAIESEWYLTYFVGGGFLLMVIWLILIETNFLASERDISKWRSFANVLLCISIIPTIIFAAEFAHEKSEIFRLSIWGLFSVLVMGIFLHNIRRVVKKHYQASGANGEDHRDSRTKQG